MFLPSYDSGYAPRDFVPEYPELWDGVVGAWCPSLGATGTSLFDQSGYGNNGTLTNFTLSSAWANPLTFDGIDDYVECSKGGMPTTKGSVGLWANGTALGTTTHWLIGNNNLNTDRDGFFIVHTSGGIRCELASASAAILTGSGKFIITDGVWTYIVLTWDGSTVTFYAGDSGTITIKDSISQTLIPTTGVYPLRIGRNSDSGSTRYWSGMIDDVVISNRCWTFTEVVQRYSGGNGRGIAYTPSSRQASLIPNIGATGNRRRRVIIGAA